MRHLLPVLLLVPLILMSLTAFAPARDI